MVQNLKILMVSLDYPPSPGGIAAHVYELCQAMVAQGHDIHLLTKAGGLDQDQKNLTLHELPPRLIGPLYGLTINRHMNRLVRDLAPDIIHIHGMRPLEFLSPKPIPIAYTNHTSGYLKRIKKGGYRIAKLKRLFKRPNLFLAPSEELLEIPFDILAPKIFIPNGVVAERFTRNAAARKKLRQELGYSDDDIVAIVTRRLVEKNGVAFLADAMASIKNPNLKLLLIGDGPEADKVRGQLEQNFTGRYHMLGSMTHDVIVPYYSAADLTILPSLMEATSISCLEAMAASLPVIATHVGGLPVLVQPHENGLLCPPADPLALAQTLDEALSLNLVKMGLASRQKVEQNFIWSRIASITTDAYRSVI
jgi:glycosyltransferase involved in cell wall biosynthesis